MLKYLIFALIVLTTIPNAKSDASLQLDNIYRLFMQDKIELKAINLVYDESVIHVGKTNSALLDGKKDFIDTNIKPTIKMLESRQFKLKLIAYVVRRVLSTDMANDVGYLYSEISLPDGKQLKQLQKYSWVFINENGIWKVITDFDATPADLAILPFISAERIIR
ncbi:MAG: hypothetical protein ABJI60_21215 [Kangiellaceae bacterium]